MRSVNYNPTHLSDHLAHCRLEEIPPITLFMFVCLPPHHLQPQQLANNGCGSPESQYSGQTGYFGSTHSLQNPSQTATMPSPPYDQSPPQINPQFIDPYTTGTSFQQYSEFNPNSMAPVSSGYNVQYAQQQPQLDMYAGVQGMQQCAMPSVGLEMPTQLHGSGVNPTFEMQATVFTTSPSSSTLCYQPANLTDLQFPAEQQAFPGYNTHLPATSANTVDRVYVNNARERYNRVACAAPGVHVGAKRPRESTSTQGRGISDWSSQWLQGTAPPAHVY